LERPNNFGLGLATFQNQNFGSGLGLGFFPNQIFGNGLGLFQIKYLERPILFKCHVASQWPKLFELLVSHMTQLNKGDINHNYEQY
jgi:hypothetical protein